MEHNLWCSWCFNKTDMMLLQHNSLKRNLYRCTNCAKEAKHCVLCKAGMARVQASDKSEHRCAACDKSISKWGERPIPLISYCSWCFILAKQQLIERDVYECENCHKKTAKCKTCHSKEETGMTRGEDKECFKCSKKITDWRWCSWCIEPTRHILESDGGMLGRNVYCCSGCGGTTTTCVMCSLALARVGDNWNEASCEVCNLPKTVYKNARTTLTKKIMPIITDKLKISNNNNNNSLPADEVEPQQEEDANEVKRKKWLDLYQQKKAVLETDHNVDLAKLEIMRNSIEKEMATKTGLIRPFLLLVSMHPAIRIQISLLLGWCSITRPSYGDSHKESWDILKMDLKGMIARANTITQNLHPYEKNCTYYDMLKQVTEEIFHIKAKNGHLVYIESLKSSVTPHDTKMQLLEEFFIENVAEARKKNMTDEERKEYKLKKEKIISPELAETNAEVMERLSISNEEAREFCKSLIEEAMEAPKDYVADMIKGLILPKWLLSGHTVMSTISDIKSSVTSPLFIIKSLYQGAQILFGPSIVKLYGPLVCILSQRIYLAVYKLEIDEYYESV